MSDALTLSMVRTKADETAVAQGCYFDLAAAERVRTFFRKFLRHTKDQWAGKPFELLDWQWEDVIKPLFGWKKPDGTRRFQVALIEIGKKNGKTPLAAGVGLYLLVGDRVHGARVFSTAVTKEQAGEVHDEAILMVDNSPALRKILKVNRSTKTIHFRDKDAFYKTLANDADSNEGKNGNGFICDEFHAWRGNHGRAFFQALQYAGRARQQPLIFIITTAGDDPNGVCFEKHKYALDIIRGANAEDTRFFAYIRAAEETDDLEDPAVWRKANPSMGITIREDNFRADLLEAKKSPSDWVAFKRYSFNIWTTGTNPAIRLDDWIACRAEFTEDDLAGKKCWAGLDLSRVRDTTSLVLVFPGPLVVRKGAEGEADEDNGDTSLVLAAGEYLVLPYFWLPAATIQNPQSPSEYRRWAEQGHLFETDGDVTDYDAVEEHLVTVADRFDLQQLLFDRKYAEELTRRVENRTGVERVEFQQNIMMFAGPTAEFERLVIGHKLRHNGHPVLAWQAGNVQFWTDRSGNKRPVKPDDARKIDGIVSLIMGLGGAMKGEEVAESGWGGFA